MPKNLSFFLIDDDDDDRELFQIALSDLNLPISFASAESGIQALSLLSKNTIHPDYIFLDLNMPRMSGRECLAELKKNAHLKHIPVIVFSTSNDPKDISDAKNMGAVEFLCKPSKTSELTQMLENFISLQKI